jgi:hypothetical protein
MSEQAQPSKIDELLNFKDRVIGELYLRVRALEENYLRLEKEKADLADKLSKFNDHGKPK